MVHTKGRVKHRPTADIDEDYFFFTKGLAVGVVKTLEPMNPILNYYECGIVNGGQSGAIGIGVCMPLRGSPLHYLRDSHMYITVMYLSLLTHFLQTYTHTHTHTHTHTLHVHHTYTHIPHIHTHPTHTSHTTPSPLTHRWVSMPIPLTHARLGPEQLWLPCR